MKGRAIPKSLLVHSAVLQKVVSQDRWGNAETESIPLSLIRIEKSSSLVGGKENQRADENYTLFFDCQNSLPKNTVFALDDTVVFEGQALKVVKVESMGGRDLHHMEVGLV